MRLLLLESPSISSRLLRRAEKSWKGYKVTESVGEIANPLFSSKFALLLIGSVAYTFSNGVIMVSILP
jgi:hypothetical protein